MAKRGIVNEISNLNELVSNLEKNTQKLIDAYENKNRKNFVKFKEIILKIQKEIQKLLNN